jgi:hypothetical protein
MTRRGRTAQAEGGGMIATRKESIAIGSRTPAGIVG